jgi:hypothetical protein
MKLALYGGAGSKTVVAVHDDDQRISDTYPTFEIAIVPDGTQLNSDMDDPRADLTDDECIEGIRKLRNQLLADSDWTMLSDSPLDQAKKDEFTVYRQDLRDLPASCDPRQPVWPLKPMYP